MDIDFNTIINRRLTPADKWLYYDADVLPMWVADMDFQSPAPIISALHARISHGIFGYEVTPKQLKEQIATWYYQKYDWRFTPDAIVFIPGVVPGFNWAIRKFLDKNDRLLIQSPVYSHIFHAAEINGLHGLDNPLIRDDYGTYTIDFDDLELKLQKKVRMFLLCNPHNPVGRVFNRTELQNIASLCLRHDVILCSDEIHGDLVYRGHRHIPIASLDPEVEKKTITLHAPSKTFNIAGLKCAFAIITNNQIRRQFIQHIDELLGSVNILGYTAALAAYQSGDKWLDKLLNHLESNREILYSYLDVYLPEIISARPEGTYLAWLDCSQLNLDVAPHQFFLENARVALNDGNEYGYGYQNFVRLNFGCPTPILMQGLQRMYRALHG